MNHSSGGTSAAFAAGLGLSALFFSAAFGRPIGAQAQSAASAGRRTAESPAPEAVIEKWPKGSRAAARAMIVKYGEPDRYTEAALVWIKNGPWQKTVVFSGSRSRFFRQMNGNYLVQTVAYRVPAEKAGDLKRFDGRLAIDESRGQLSARSESERINFLALNLADEIVMGGRSVEDARAFYLKTDRLSKAGKSSPYMEGLLFTDRHGERPSGERLDTEYDQIFKP